jgi:hypothetical protein
MDTQSEIAELRKQLELAKIAETSALAEYTRYGTDYYEREWVRAGERVRDLANKLAQAEKQPTAEL